MAYLKQVAGIGLTKHGRPVILYRISAHPRLSIKATAYDTLVSIEPTSSFSPEQNGTHFYDAIRVYNPTKVTDILSAPEKEYDHVPFAVVGNGSHIETIYEYLRGQLSLDNTDQKRLKKELESFFSLPLTSEYVTPEVIARCGLPWIAAGIMLHYLEDMIVLGLVEEWSKARISVQTDWSVRKGRALLFPYGRIPKTISPIKKTRIISVNGDTPQEVADSFFQTSTSKSVISSASAVWFQEEDKWKLAVKNLFE